MCEITTAGGEGLRNLIESMGLFSTGATARITLARFSPWVCNRECFSSKGT
jgi:hypothetical protein